MEAADSPGIHTSADFFRPPHLITLSFRDLNCDKISLIAIIRMHGGNTMGTYDLKRLEIAIQYIRRMSEGRNPVTNRPAPENEVLTNINVHRCLKFIDEVLTDVHKAGGTVGLVPTRTRTAKATLSETFPYEILDQYRYEQDQQISYFLKQLESYLPEDRKIPVPATAITNWMRENGYLEKKVINDTGKENSVPSKKGEQLGIYAEKGGVYPNEYYRVFYDENAQRFIIENFRRILTESEAIRERNRLEKKSEGSPRSTRQGGNPRSNSNSRPDGNSRPDSNSYNQDQRNTARRNNSAQPPQYAAPDYIPEPMPAEELPKEYYDMLSEGWSSVDDDMPF